MKHWDATVSPTCANVAFRGMSSTTTASRAIEIHLTLRTPWASGYAHTHTLLAGLLLASFLTAVSLVGCVGNSGIAPVDVYR